MRCNMAGWDRFVRLVFGILVTAWAIAGGPWWAYFGLVLVATAAWRFCPFYALLRTGTARGRD